MRVAVLVLFAQVAGSTPLRAAEKPNILFIYADDLGYGDVGCYGAEKIKTPNIDRLASQGLRFTDGHAASSTCTPSRYALLTGEYAWRKQGTGVLPGDAAAIITPDRITLPSILKQAGYRTGAVGKWHLGLGAGNLDWNGDIRPGPQEIGFDYAFIMAATGDRVPCVFLENRRVVNLELADPIRVSYKEKVGDEPTGAEHPEMLRVKPSHGHDQTIVNGISRIGYMAGGKAARWKDEDNADIFTSKAVHFIEETKDQPFFLYFATHDPHVPRVPHPRFAGTSGCGVRGDVIQEFDWCVGEVLGTLDRLGLAEKTLVILTSDNGPVVDDGYRDGAVENLNGHKPAGALRGGKYSLFEGGTRVPWITRWTGHIKPGVTDALVCQVDLMASFAALAGQPLPAEAAPDSFNVLPALLGESKTGRENLVVHSNGVAFRQGAWKFIPAGKGVALQKNTNTETGKSPEPQLYDLASDLGETKNVATENAEKVKEMSAQLQSIQKSARSRP
jgi:arylsulfatase A-like enzyme